MINECLNWIIPSSLHDIYTKLLYISKRFPKWLGKNFFQFTHTLLLLLGEAFCQKQPSSLIIRLALSYFFFEQKLKNRSLKQATLLVRAFQKSSTIMSLCLVMPPLESEKRFGKTHISKCLRQLLPNFQLMEDVFIAFRTTSSFFYLEVKKMRGKSLTTKEVANIQKKLPFELSQSIEHPLPSISFYRNEEEMYRIVMMMHLEFQSLDDYPHLFLSFQETSRGYLCFSGICVCAEKHDFWQQLKRHLPPEIIVILEKETTVGMIDKQYPKKSFFFTLEIKSAPFLQKNGTVDLLQARHFLVKSLELALGPLRDYNGGLLEKIHERLADVKSFYRKKDLFNSALLEQFFYALRPAEMQVVIDKEVIYELFSLFLKAKESSKLLHFQEIKEACCVVVKIKKEALKQQLFRMITLNERSAWAAVNDAGKQYLCFLRLQGPHADFLEIIQTIVNSQNTAEVLSPYTLRLHFQIGDPLSLHPHSNYELRNQSLLRVLFEGLTRLDPTGKPRLAAAEKVTISSKQTLYTFKLRPNKWSNGETVTTAHFAIAWKRAIMRTTENFPAEGIFYPIKNVLAAKKGHTSFDKVGIRVVDDQILVVELEKPSPSFLTFLAEPFYYPLYEVLEEPSIFNGPYLLYTWERGELIHLIQNPHYWDSSHVFFKSIEVGFQQDIDLIAQRFESKQLDWIGDPFTTFTKIKTRGKKVTRKTSRMAWLFCNTQHSPLQNKQLRKALSLAIDRKKLAEMCNQQVPCHSLLPPSLSLLKEKKPLHAEIKKAKTAYQQALKELGCSSLTLTLNFSHLFTEVGNYLRKQWKSILGLEIILLKAEWNEFLRLCAQDDYHLACYWITPSYPNPYAFFEIFKQVFHVRNHSRWEDAEYQYLLTLAENQVDPVQSNYFLKQAEVLLNEEMPVIPLFAQRLNCILEPTIMGVQDVTDASFLDIRWMSRTFS